jgi:hypothetical protein
MKNLSTTGVTFVKTAGLLSFVGAIIGAIGSIVTGFIPPAVSPDLFSYPYTPAGFLTVQFVYMLSRVLLLVGIVALARSGVVGTGLLGRVALWISVVGMAALTLCEIGAMRLAASPYSDFIETAYGFATIVIGSD